MKITDIKNGKKLVSYWQNSFIESSSPKIDILKAIKIPVSQITNGQITDNLVLNKMRKEAGEKQSSTVNVCLSLSTASREINQFKRASSNDIPITIICIKAKLNVDSGVLTITKKTPTPSVNRKLLSPGHDVNLFELGSLERHNEYKKKYNGAFNDWQDILDYANNIIQFIQDIPDENEEWTLPKDYFKANWGYIHLDDDFPPDAIIAGYQSLLDGNDGQINPLFERLIEGAPDKVKAVNEAIALTSTSHTGSMSNAYPSTTSQRTAIHHALTAKQGEVIAVNGPPGTGKTTLLQSVIASKWVTAAIEQDRPPLIIATAANNQAVTNIISSFSNALDDTERFWRTESIRTLGLFLCSSLKKKEAQKAGYLYASPDFYTKSPLAHEDKLKLLGSFCDDLQQKETLARETQYFLKRAEEASLKEAVATLHHKLMAQHSALLSTLTHVTTALDEGITLDSKLADVQEVALNIRADSDKVNQKIDELERLTQATKQAVATRPFWMMLFSFLPIIKMATRERLQSLLPKMGYIDHEAMVSIYGQNFERSDNVQEVYKSLDRFEEQFKQEENKALDQALSMNAIIELFETNTKQNETTFREIISRKLDCEHRFTLFSLTLNYWYGRFLLEATELLKAPIKPQGKKEILTRYAMVTPCIVSTMANLSKSVGETKYWQQGDTRTVIDLLIIDEAGQSTPEQSAYFLSLAKNALIVGDEKQIEPVFGVEKTQDIGNLEYQAFNTDQQSIETYKQDKFMSSNGNLMGMALRACHVMTTESVPGLFLKEHFRCQKDIMDYFNELSYDGMLIPMSPENTTHHQKMGFVNVTTLSEKVHSSRINKGQISAALKWLETYGEELVALHGNKDSTLETEIAILTPFKEMELEIKIAAKAAGIKTTGSNAMTIGTVHSLQGAERNIVLFLATYGSSDVQHGFIDNQSNLLNVAVSRAKKHFIVFGDRETLSQNKNGKAVHQLYDRLSPWDKKAG